MNYLKITPSDTSNGDGLRVVLWLSGCDHHCEGCHNPQSWNPSNGKKFDVEDLHYLCILLGDPFIDGLTISGGDPLHPINREEVIQLVLKIKHIYPMKNIWLWTGYTMSEIQQMEGIQRLFKNVDYIIDGKYEKDLHCRDRYRGSTNQKKYHIVDSIPTIVD